MPSIQVCTSFHSNKKKTCSRFAFIEVLNKMVNNMPEWKKGAKYRNEMKYEENRR